MIFASCVCIRANPAALLLPRVPAVAPVAGTDLDSFEVDPSGVEPIQIGKGQVTAPQIDLLPTVAGEGAAAEI